MAEVGPFRRGGRFRSLTILAGITVVVAGLAVFALHQSAETVAPKFQPKPLFPDLASQLNDLGAITVTSKGGTVHIRKVAGKGFVVVDKYSYPADPNVVTATGIGLVNLTAIEPKTAKPEYFHLLNLVAPDKGGKAVHIVLTDTKGKTMADLLIGLNKTTTDDQGRHTLYVRRNGENQTWLARSTLDVRVNAADWLNGNVLAVTRDRIQSAHVVPAKGPAYTVSRKSKNDPDYTLVDVPPGKELTYAGAADSVATGIADFDIQDVRPASNFDFAKANQVSIRTFDGLVVTVRVLDKDALHWATVSAAAENDKEKKEADAINAKTAGWAFQLADYRASPFETALSSLLKAKGT